MKKGKWPRYLPRTSEFWAGKFMIRMKKMGFDKYEITDKQLDKLSTKFCAQAHVRKSLLLDHMLKHGWIEPSAGHTWAFRFDKVVGSE